LKPITRKKHSWIHLFFGWGHPVSQRVLTKLEMRRLRKKTESGGIRIQGAN